MDDQVDEYHFHVYFFQHNPTSRDLAFQLRRDFALFVEERLLVAAFDNVHEGPIGPHPTGSYEIWVPAEYFEPVLSWFLIHRPTSISILCHPLTRHELLDHTARAIWLGTPLGLDLSALSPELDRAPSRYQTLRLGYAKIDSDAPLGDFVQPVVASNRNEQSEKEFDELRDSMCSVCSDDEIESQPANHVPATSISNTNQNDIVGSTLDDNAASLSRANHQHNEISSTIVPAPSNTSRDVTTDQVTSNINTLPVSDRPELIVADSNNVTVDHGTRKKKKKSKEKKQKKTKRSSSTLVASGSRSAMPIPVVNPYLVSTQQVKTALQTLTVFPSATLSNTHIERPVHREPPPVPVPVIPAFTPMFGYTSTLLNPPSQATVHQVIQQQSSVIRRNDINMLIDTHPHSAAPAQEFPVTFQSTEQTVDVQTVTFPPEQSDAPAPISNHINADTREELDLTPDKSDLVPHVVQSSEEHAIQHQPFPTEKQAPLILSSAPSNINQIHDSSDMPQLSTASHGTQVTDAPTAILLEPHRDASIATNSSALLNQGPSVISVPVTTSASLIDARGPDHIQSEQAPETADLPTNVTATAKIGTNAPYHTGQKRSRETSPSRHCKRQRLSPSIDNDRDISRDSGSESDSDNSSSSSSVRIIGVNQVYRSSIDEEEIDARPVSDLRSEMKPKSE